MIMQEYTSKFYGVFDLKNILEMKGPIKKTIYRITSFFNTRLMQITAF